MKSEALYEQAYQHSLKMIEAGARDQEVLTYLATAAETVGGPGIVCSILVLDKTGLLRNGASPQLPADYLKAIDGLKPDPGIGTCAAAAATGSIIITDSFYADNKWVELRHLPLSLGFYGAWSMPITTADKKVLGTFGTYFRDKRKPTEEEIKGIGLLASAAALVLVA